MAESLMVISGTSFIALAIIISGCKVVKDVKIAISKSNEKGARNRMIVYKFEE